VVSRFVRKVRTSSGAVAVQVVTRRGRQIEQVEHLGSANTDAELALLLSAARERLSPGQDALDLGDLASVPPRIDRRRHPLAQQVINHRKDLRRGRPEGLTVVV
jgi:hypothetical protein